MDLGGKHYRLARSIESVKRRINQDKRWAKWAHAKDNRPGQGHDHGHGSRQALRSRITLARYCLPACFASAIHSFEMKKLRFGNLESPGYFSGLLLTNSSQKRIGIQLDRDAVPSWLCVVRQGRVDHARLAALKTGSNYANRP